jgi:hypothetical protein
MFCRLLHWRQVTERIPAGAPGGMRTAHRMPKMPRSRPRTKHVPKPRCFRCAMTPAMTPHITRATTTVASSTGALRGWCVISRQHVARRVWPVTSHQGELTARRLVITFVPTTSAHRKILIAELTVAPLPIPLSPRRGTIWDMGSTGTLRAFAVAAALVFSVAFAAPAHADQNGFLNMLANNDAPVEPDETDAMLHLGYAVCEEIYTDGWSEQRAVSKIMTTVADASPRRAQLIVTAAHSQLCPDAG